MSKKINILTGSCNGVVHRDLLQETDVKTLLQETEYQQRQRMKHNFCLVFVADYVSYCVMLQALFSLECSLFVSHNNYSNTYNNFSCNCC